MPIGPTSDNSNGAVGPMGANPKIKSLTAPQYP